MMRTRLVMVFLLGFCAGLLVRAGISTAHPLPAYAISVDTVMQRFQDPQDLFLVDVREERQFTQVRIPGSLNIPLFAVKTKAFLKTKPVVLIDEGYRPHHLEETCEQLTQAGFEAHFLFGGLNAWHTRSAKESLQRSAQRALLPLHGDVFAQKALNTMPPRALFAEQKGKYWLLIDVSADGDSQELTVFNDDSKEHPPGPPQGGNTHPQHLPRGEHPPGPPQGGNTHSQPPSTGRRTGIPDNAVDVSPGSADILSASDAGETPALPGGELFSQARSVPFDRDNPEPFLTHLEQTVADAAVRSERFLVLISNQHGEDYEQIERMLRNADIAPVFFLQGGIEAYQKFWAQQESLKQAPAHSEKTLNACPCCR